MKIDRNSVVAFNYVLTDANSGQIIDQSNGNALEFLVGHGHIIPGLEKEMMGMQVGDKATINVAPEEAYGVYDENAVQTLPAEQFAGLELSAGMPLYGQAEDGTTVQVTVKSFDEQNVTIDHNHPLAGKTLSFAITIESVREASADEVLSGQIACDNSSGGHCGGCGCGGH